jgi:hypothetical protein
MKRSNGYNAAELENYLGAIDDADSEMFDLKTDYMRQCKGPRQRIKDTMSLAKENGINLTAFKAIVSAHRAERKLERKIADLEPDDLSDYEMMADALGAFGDTPLGAAALEKAKARGDKTLSNLS